MTVISRKKVAVLLPSLAGGGAERSMLSLAGGIAAAGLSVDLVLSNAVGTFLSQVPEGVNIVDLRSKRVSRSVPALTRYLRRARPDGMISALSRTNVAAIVARGMTGLPSRLIINEQNNLSNWLRDSQDLRTRLMMHLVRLGYRSADVLVAVSRGVADDLISTCGIRAKRLEVVFNPGAVPGVLEKAAIPLDHEWYSPEAPPVFVAVGRLAPQKNFENLLNAFATVRESRVARLIILGEGPERSKLEELALKLGVQEDVLLPGFVENPYQYMSRSAAFVLSSDFEGLPTVLVEAMMTGVPLIATDCPSGPREILEDGKYGLLVQVGRSDMLAAAMERTLNGDCPTTTSDSWLPYTLDEVVKDYLELLFGGRRYGPDHTARLTSLHS